MTPTADIILRKDFLKAMLVSSQYHHVPPTQIKRLYYQTLASLMCLLFKCFKLESSGCIVFNAFAMNPAASWVAEQNSIRSSTALRTPGEGTSIKLRACAEPCQREAANQSTRGDSSLHWSLSFSFGVKTEGMTLRLMAPHIYSHEVGSIRH